MNYGYENNYNGMNNTNMNFNSSNNYGVQKTNTLAIVGFILTFFPFLALIGWILCIVALFQIKKSGEKGKVLAIIGIVWPLVAVAILLTIIIFLAKVVVDNIETITEEVACSYGPSYTLSEDGGSLICGDEVDGIYTCEFTIGGESKIITCDMNE